MIIKKYLRTWNGWRLINEDNVSYTAGYNYTNFLGELVVRNQVFSKKEFEKQELWLLVSNGASLVYNRLQLAGSSRNPFLLSMDNSFPLSFLCLDYRDEYSVASFSYVISNT